MNAKSANRQIIAGQATVDLIKEIWQSSSSSHMIVRMINLITLIIAQFSLPYAEVDSSGVSFQPLVLSITSANLDVLIHLTSTPWYKRPDAEATTFAGQNHVSKANEQIRKAEQEM
ncbi:hypothetical protein IWW34DRAFT_784435 [Fusarium oxysporum f. sp. albedinis]|nr:hypothetical protein IWW34DRAFT_784435 [Fusarium oxysporum f. sp. albedinis]